MFDKRYRGAEDNSSQGKNGCDATLKRWCARQVGIRILLKSLQSESGM